ncbi:MAG: NrtA/SsuA/CpmA family ABC transporter substrate-binding protein [Alphaproteobacteria bacterium]|nr:NrtA/SsuA/CpmA family ABC transporter substrate-binding protein [Alphaproteobacteria bacterium]
MESDKVKMRRSATLLGLSSAVALVVVIYFMLQAPGKIDNLRLGAYDGDVGALEWIAQERGFFDKVGLTVEMKPYPSGNAAVDAMRKGEVDVATAADLVVAKRSFKEKDLRVLADICRYWNKGLVGRRDHGISTPADLKGKRIGVSATSSAEHNLVVFLALQGLTMEDVTLVDLPPKRLVEEMSAGLIDAAITWQPHVAAIVSQLGDNAVLIMDGGTEANLLILTLKDQLPIQTEALKKLMKGLVMADDWVRENPQEAKTYLISRFKLDRDYIEALWPRMQLSVSLPQEILGAMDSEARWLAKSANVETLPNFAETIHAAPLASVRPSAVSVFTK